MLLLVPLLPTPSPYVRLLNGPSDHTELVSVSLVLWLSEAVSFSVDT